MRVSVGATAGVGGPQGAGSTPPASTTTGMAYNDPTTRAKWIVGGLFVLLVFLHSKGK